MPNYSKQGKIMIPLTPEQFIKGMSEGKFAREKHRGLAALLYYTGIRISEGLRAKKEQFSLQENRIYFEVGKRLKHGATTPPLIISLKRRHAGKIWEAAEETRSRERVWPYCRRTGYSIIARVWSYPHHLRLTRITDLFSKGYTIPEVKTYTGLTLPALDFYIGVVAIEKMAES